MKRSSFNNFFLTVVITSVFSIFLSDSSLVMATPYFSLDTASEWESALNPPPPETARVIPVSQPYPALENHYLTQYPDFIYVTPELYVYEGQDPGELPGEGLVMAWGDNSDLNKDKYQVASWEYIYPEDPNLIGTLLMISILPPPGILSVSLTINDAAGGWISWDWNIVPPAQPPLGLPQGVLSTITINPIIFGPQSGSTSFAVAGFNPMIATSIQADELSVGAINWNFFQPVGINNGAKPWNYWGNLQVIPVPEPATILLLGSGLIGLAGLRKRLKKA